MRKGIVLSIFILIVVFILSSACLGNKSQINTTPTYSPEAVSLHEQGLNAFVEGNYSIALDYYNKSINADPGYTRAWMDKGNALMVLKRPTEAVAVYDIVLQRQDDLPLIWNMRGEALMESGNYTGARDSFEKALKYMPDYQEALKNREIAISKIR